MYNETYDNYIRSILGYPPKEHYGQDYRSQEIYNNINISNNNIELEKSYPEIYNVVYPMVSNKCNNVRNINITNDDIEKMTDEIYYEIEGKDAQTNNVAKVENRKTENRQINFGVRDLIKILLIRELLNRPRPPYRPGPGRPPFNRDFGSIDKLYEQF